MSNHEQIFLFAQTSLKSDHDLNASFSSKLLKNVKRLSVCVRSVSAFDTNTFMCSPLETPAQKRIHPEDLEFYYHCVGLVFSWL